MSDDLPKLQRRAGGLLLPIARGYRRRLDRGLAALSVSHSMALAVMLIGRADEGVRQGALADQLGMEPPSVVPIVDQGERAGLVERRVHPGDRRVRTLHLTAAGRELSARAELLTKEVRAEVFQGIDAADLVTALSVLERISRAIEQAEQA